MCDTPSYTGAAVIELIPFLCHRLRVMFNPVADALHMHYSYWQPTEDLVPQISDVVSYPILSLY